MTERKLTDEEVIKALKCCSKDNIKDCDACPYVDIDTKTYCVNEMIKDALDLINRKNTEIERYEAERQEIFDKDIAMAVSKAIKEFAEELKYEFNVDASANFNRWIDKKVKEKTEKNKGQAVSV